MRRYPALAAGSDAEAHRRSARRLAVGDAGAKDIKRVEDLKGKSIAVTRPGDLTFRLARAMLKKFNLSES